MAPRRPDPLGDVRPGARPSWWLREALADDPGEPVAPLVGDASADVAIVGGGFTGLWTAFFITESDPSVRVRVIEQGICGGGPSGRNGGFVTSWWDEIDRLVADFGVDAARELGRLSDEAIGAIGDWCTAHGVDAWYRRAGYIFASAAPSQDDAFEETLEALARMGVADACIPLTADEVRDRCASPVLRKGLFVPGAATVQPARLARGLRRVLLERGVTIHEGTRLVGFDRPPTGGRSGTGSADDLAGPVELRTDAGGVPGRIRADQAVFGLNAWAAGWPWAEGRLITWSSYIVLTEPIPDRLAELGWTGGEGIADARFTLHYLRTTPDGRIAIGGGGGRSGWGGRIGAMFTHDAASARLAARGLRRLFPGLADVRIDDAWGGPIDICDDHRPFFGSLPGGRIHFGHGYSGNGVGPSHLGGRILAALALGRADDPVLALPIVGRRSRRFPPEPFRSVGAFVAREASARREAAEEAERRVSPVLRELSRFPRRFGYRLGLS